MLAEDNKASEDEGRVSSLIDKLIHEADREDIPEHLRVLARRLEVALAQQRSNPKFDD